MEGVNILAEETCREYSILLGISIIIFALSLFFLIYHIMYVTNTNKFVSSICCILIFAICIAVIAYALSNMTTFYTKQKVTIDESVSFVEFTEHYQIISQEGEIYTVKLLTN